jgi:glycerophosphoryl diester phosphodiesterase
MAAFRKAQELGSPGLELDVQLCGSGELVVMHDASLKRTTGMDTAINQVSHSELRRLDAGSWYSSAFSSERIPLLSEVLEEFSGRLYIDIELKSRLVKDDPLPLVLAKLLNGFLSGTGKHALVSVSSFNPFALASFKRAAPRIPTAIIWSADTELPWYLRAGQGRWLSQSDYLKPVHSKATSFSLVLSGKIGGYQVIPWVVDTMSHAGELIGRGCDGVITNRPQDLVPTLCG